MDGIKCSASISSEIPVQTVYLLGASVRKQIVEDD